MHVHQAHAAGWVRRNRLLAALSGATVIPEAGPRSGSMTTVIAGRDLGRGVGAVPGPVTSVASVRTRASSLFFVGMTTEIILSF